MTFFIVVAPVIVAIEYKSIFARMTGLEGPAFLTFESKSYT